MSIKHAKTSNRPNGTDSSLIQPSDWNQDHVVDELILPVKTSPTIPPADNVNFFSRNVGGRILPAIVGPAGLDTPLQPFLARNNVAWWCAPGGSTAVNLMGAAAAFTVLGTATAAAYALTNNHTKFKRVDYLVTTAATTAIASWRYSAMWSRETGFHMILRGSPATGQATTVTTGRFFMGMANTTAAPTDVAVNTQVSCIGAGFEGTDTIWQLFVNDAAGTCTKIPLTGLPRYNVDRASMYELVLFAAPGSTGIYYEVTDLGSGVKVTGFVTTDIPTASTLLAPRMWASVGGTSSVIGCTFVSLYIESDI